MSRDVLGEDTGASGESYSPTHVFPGPIEVDDSDGLGSIGVKLGTVTLPEARYQATVSAFAQNVDVGEGNLGNFQLVVIPEDVDPFDADVLTAGTSYPSGAAPFTDWEPVTNAIIARPDTQPVIVAGDLTVDLVATDSVDVWLTHPDVGFEESLSLPDGIEVYIG